MQPMRALRSKDLDVDLRHEGEKVIIEGKTGVPFETFVTLILQRKVFSLLKHWGKMPVVIDSELLTSLASAPQDTHEDRGKLVKVTFGAGILAGIFFTTVGLVILNISGIRLGTKELAIIAGGIVLLGLLVSVIGRAPRKSRGEKLTENMEKLATMLSK